MLRIFLISCFFGLLSCNTDNGRIDLIKEKTNLNLPQDYQILKNESIDAGSFDGDFSIYIDLKFNKENFAKLESRISMESKFGNWFEDSASYRFESFDFKEPVFIHIDKERRVLKFEMHHL